MRSTVIIALVLVTVAGACARKPAPVVEVVPVSVEPTDTGKYK